LKCRGGKVDGLSDLKVIETELMLLDLQHCQNRIERIEKELKKLEQRLKQAILMRKLVLLAAGAFALEASKSGGV